MNDAQRPKRYYVSKTFICAAIVLQIVHLFLNFRAEMSLVLLLSGISLASVVAFQITFMGFAGVETRVVAVGYAISAVWTTVLRLFINAHRAPGAGFDTLLAGFNPQACAAALFEVLVFIVITLSFTDVIKGRKYVAAVAVAAKLAIFTAFAADAEAGTNLAFMSEFIKGDSALVTYIRTGEYAGGQDIERFFEVIFTTLALLGYLVFFIRFTGDQNREDPYGIVNTKAMVFVSAISLGAAQICWIDRIIAKIHALTGARKRSVLREVLCVIFIPLYFFFWLLNRGKRVREEGLKMGYALPNRGAASVILSIFTLGIAGSALLQSDLNQITTDSHDLLFEEDQYEEDDEPSDYARGELYTEQFDEPAAYDNDSQDDSMFRPENRQYADEGPGERPPAIIPPAFQPPPQPPSFEHEDSAYSESPTLQYPYVGLPKKQEPGIRPEQPPVFNPDIIKPDDRPQEPAAKVQPEDTRRETAAMSVTEASSRLEGLKSVMEAIRELSELKNEGLITDDEFSKTKMELLSRL